MASRDSSDSIKIIRPDIVNHCDPGKKSRLAIYSIDFQYGGYRFATGGGDTTVKIWDAHSMVTSTDSSDDFLLATLSNHSKSVNVVRWSRDGQYLASGSDDCYVLIYERSFDDSISSQPFGSSVQKNRENWSRSLTLRGHTMDVLDLDWSPRGVLASASIDNTVIIWGDIVNKASTVVGANGRVVSPLRVLTDHISFVKGISFDPFGTYLASSSADNAIIVWSCETWTVACTVRDLLEEAPDRSIFRRMSWAPDGGSLCVTAGHKAGKPVGIVIKRGTWESVADLVGHSAQSTCCRFNPQTLMRESESSSSSNKKSGDANTPKKTRMRTACTVALGDQKGVVSVWTTVENTPMIVLDDVFTGPVLDISWAMWGEGEQGAVQTPAPPAKGMSSLGLHQGLEQHLLAMCSIDGTVVLLALVGQGVVGGKRVLTRSELESHLRTLYGRSTQELIKTPEALPEGPMVLHYKNKANIPHTTGGHIGHAVPVDIGGAPPSATSSSLMANRMSNSSRTIDPATITHSTATVLPRQIVGTTKSGKKRIQPLSVLSSDIGACGSGVEAETSSSASQVETSDNASVKRPRLVTSTVDAVGSSSAASSVPMHTHGVNTVNYGNGSIKTGASFTFQRDATICRPHGNTSDSAVGLSVCVKSAGGSVASAPLLGLSRMLQEPRSALTVVAKTLPRPRELSAVRTFGLQLTSLCAVDASGPTTPLWRSHVSGVVFAIAALQFSPDSSGGVDCSGVCVTGTSDGCMQLFDLKSGMRLSPAIVLGTAVAFVDVWQNPQELYSSVRILSVTADGDIFIHTISLHNLSSTNDANSGGVSSGVGSSSSSNIGTGRLRLVLQTSLRSVLMSMQQQQHLHRASSTGNGSGVAEGGEGQARSHRSSTTVWIEKCFLVPSSGDVAALLHCEGADGGDWQVFQFCVDIQSWVRLLDMRGFVCSHFLSSPVGSPVAGADSLVAEVVAQSIDQNISVRDISRVSRSLMTASSFTKEYTAQLSMCHIEEQLLLCILLGKAQEMRSWLSEWVSHCCQAQASVERVRELVNSLLLFERNRFSGAIMGWSSLLPNEITKSCNLHHAAEPDVLSLIKDCVFPAIASSGRCQDLLAELNDALDIATQHQSHETQLSK